MGIQPQTARAFEKSSPVADYWLAQCEGFRVTGAVRGTVEKVVGSGELHQAEALVVRTARGRRTVAVGAVGAVIPADRLIVLDGRPEPTAASRRTRTGVQAVSRGSRAVASNVRRTAPRAGRSGLRAADVAGKAVRTLAMLVAAGVVTIGRAVAIVIVKTERLAARNGERMRQELDARQLAAAERRRRTAAPKERLPNRS